MQERQPWPAAAAADAAEMHPAGLPNASLARDLEQCFRHPPRGWGAVPFWWWSGDRLDPARLRWQLDRLRPGGLAGVQVNYNHGVGGGRCYGLTDDGEPGLFTRDWWKMWRRTAALCRRRGLGLGLSDYTLSWPGQGWWTERALPAAARAARVLRLDEHGASEGDLIDIPLPAHAVAVCALAVGARDPAALLDLAGHAGAGRLMWLAPAGEWRVLIVRWEQDSARIDACHPAAGRSLVAGLHEPCGRAADGAGNFFFQDEFFQPSEPIWHPSLPPAIGGARFLPALLIDLGPAGAALRIRWQEAVGERMRRCFFAPVGRWHARRGLIYGCDQPGRGLSPAEYGDYMAALRHFTAPGHDVPAGGVDAFKAKCSASAAHLSGRPRRVWMEAFHSAGWGFQPGRVVGDILANFAAGCNLLSLHGLYYSTRGGFWEWAPPCYHWRQPYWDHLAPALRGLGRLSFVMAQGRIRCQVAVVYPTAPAQAGQPPMQAIAVCRAIVEGLWRSGIDCILIDRTALASARVRGGRLHVAGSAHAALVLPGLSAVHAVAARRAVELADAGGTALVVEPRPATTENGPGDPLLGRLGALETVADAAQAIARLELLPRDFRGPAGAVAQHRRIGRRDAFHVVGAPGGSRCWFAAAGRVELWDIWTGRRRVWSQVEPADGGTWVHLPAEGGVAGSWLVMFSPGAAPRPAPQPAILAPDARRVPLDGPWDVVLQPTLDNRWGDFRLPAGGMIGPEIRRFDDGSEVGYGARFLALAAGADAPVAAARTPADLADLHPQPVTLSWRWGVPGDPGFQGWHGLKARFDDHIFAIGRPREPVWAGDHAAIAWHDDGPRWLWTQAVTARPIRARIVAGGLPPEDVFVDGRRAAVGEVIALRAGRTPVAARYAGAGRGHLVLIDAASADPPRPELGMRWHDHPGLIPFDPRPARCAADRLSVIAPPGLRRISGRIRGACSIVAAGRIARTRVGAPDAVGWRPFTTTIPRTSPDPIQLRLRVRGAPGCAGAAAFAGPLTLDCDPGRLPAGDWSQIGALADYSGRIVYARDLIIADGYADAVLDLGEVSASAKIRINGRDAGILLGAPWRLPIGGLLHPGRNRLEIDVASTLANHYRTIPTRYRGPLVAGLLGPVALELR